MIEDFSGHVHEFSTAGFVDVSFLRWSENTTVIAGVAIDDGYQALTLSPVWVFVPTVPKDEIERLPVGDRHRSGVLVWSLARDFFGGSYDMLRGIDSVERTRPDRIVDNDRGGLVYEVVTEWKYDRQAGVSAAIALLVGG